MVWAGRAGAHGRVDASVRVVLGAFLVATVPLVATHVVPLTAETAILAGLGVFALSGRRPRTAWPWALWLWGVVVLDDLRGLQRVTGAPHAADVAALESRIFGVQPVIELQHRFASGAGLTAHDVVISAVYLMHSPAPLIAGAALWAWRRDLFGPFVVSMLTAATIGWAVYLAFPESPPWLAAQHGVIPPVRRITDEVIAHAGPLASVYGGADPLPNAAMPSLHVAYPCLVAAWMVTAFGRRALWLVLYPASLAVGVVYLGEHWVVDSIAGLVVAGAAFLTGLRWGRWFPVAPLDSAPMSAHAT